MGKNEEKDVALQVRRYIIIEKAEEKLSISRKGTVRSSRPPHLDSVQRVSHHHHTRSAKTTSHEILNSRSRFLGHGVR